MKVVLVDPRMIFYPWVNVGILYIAAYLEKYGYEVVYIDTNPKEELDSIAKKIIDLKPDIIGFSVTSPQIGLASRIAKCIKDHIAVDIVLGGYHPTVCYEEILNNNPEIDYIVVGEGEVTFKELCDARQSELSGEDLCKIAGLALRINNEIRFTGNRAFIEDLDALPFPGRHLLSSEWYFAPKEGVIGAKAVRTTNVSTSRGCPYRCRFCSHTRIWRNKVRRRSPQNVIDELTHLREVYDVDSVIFFDDIFTLNREWVFDFCNLLIEQNWENFVWECYSRVDTVDEEILTIMKKAGCFIINYGVESGSPAILKKINKKITPEQIENAFNLSKKVGIATFAFIIVGSPGETMEDVKLTKQLLKKIQPDCARFVFAIPFPGTEFYDEMAAKGIFEGYDSFISWFEHKAATCYHDEPWITYELNKKELLKIRSNFQNIMFRQRYAPFFKDPHLFLQGLQYVIKGIYRLPAGIKRMFRTGRIDAIFSELYKGYLEIISDKSAKSKFAIGEFSGKRHDASWH